MAVKVDNIDSEVKSLEKEIGNDYINIINDLISHYEVYQHDLHPNISENIVMLFQSFALAKTEYSDAKLELMQAAKSQSLITMRELYVRLLNVYYDEIRLLRKSNRLYKQKAVVLEGTEISFKTKTDKEFSNISKEYKKLRKKYKFVLKEKGEDEILLDKESLKDLICGYERTKKLLELYEEYIPKIIGSGYKGAWKFRFVNSVYWWISLLLTILGLVMFLINRNII